MKHQKPKPFIIFAKFDPGLTLTYFMAKSNSATYAFKWENVTTMMDSLESIAFCGLKLMSK